MSGGMTIHLPASLMFTRVPGSIMVHSHMVDWCPEVFWLVNGWKWRMLWFLDGFLIPPPYLDGQSRQGDGTGKYFGPCRLAI